MSVPRVIVSTDDVIANDNSAVEKKKQAGELTTKNSVPSDTDVHDSGHSSGNDSDIVTVKMCDLKQHSESSQLKVRCQSADNLDISRGSNNKGGSNDEKIKVEMNTSKECSGGKSNGKILATTNGNVVHKRSRSSNECDLVKSCNKSVNPNSKSASTLPKLNGILKKKGILKKSTYSSNNGSDTHKEKVTFVTKCTDCEQEVRFIETTGRDIFVYSNSNL